MYMYMGIEATCINNNNGGPYGFWHVLYVHASREFCTIFTPFFCSDCVLFVPSYTLIADGALTIVYLSLFFFFFSSFLSYVYILLGDQSLCCWVVLLSVSFIILLTGNRVFFFLIIFFPLTEWSREKILMPSNVELCGN